MLISYKQQDKKISNQTENKSKKSLIFAQKDYFIEKQSTNSPKLQKSSQTSDQSNNIQQQFNTSITQTTNTATQKEQSKPKEQLIILNKSSKRDNDQSKQSLQQNAYQLQEQIEEEPQRKEIKELQQQSVVRAEALSYFLSAEPEFELQNNSAYVFDTKILKFNLRNYTSQASATHRQTFMKQDQKIQRNPPNKREKQEIEIKRQKPQQDIIEKEREIKQSQQKVLEAMKQKSQDESNKKINDIRLYLNILTPTNFDNIKKKFLEFIKVESLCEFLVEGIIEKARTQQLYIGLYANLCKYLADQSKVIFKRDEPQFIYFKNNLINNIQQTFQGEKSIFEGKMTTKKQKSLNEMNEEERKLYFEEKKVREMLTLRFIGCLYLNNCINPKIIQICIEELLSRYIQGLCELKDSQIQNQDRFEDHLEGLIQLLDQTGQSQEEKMKENKELDKVQPQIEEIKRAITKRKYSEISFEKLKYCEYFHLLQWLIENNIVSPRIYSLIKNLLEKKENNWNERAIDQANKGPQHQDQIRKEFYEERMKAKLETEIYFKNQKEQQKYQCKSQQKPNQNGLYDDEEEGRKMAKVIWGKLDAQNQFQENYSEQNAIDDFKLLRQKFSPLLYGQILIKTVYDCSVEHKERRLAVAFEAMKFISSDEFIQALNLRLNKSKDESADFPLFLSFLSNLFVEIYNSGKANLKDINIKFKDHYDEDDREDLIFVFKEFFNECAELLQKQEFFDAQKMLDEQIKGVLQDKDECYDQFEKQFLKQFSKK